MQGEGHSRFVLVRWRESDVVPKELPFTEGDDADLATQPISIEFNGSLEAANGAVPGYLSCSRFLGSYEELASGMRFGNLVSIHMVCDPTRMELEAAFLEAFRPPLTTISMQPSANDKQGHQVIWETTSGVLL